MAVRVQVPLRVRAEADRLRFVFFCFYTPIKILHALLNESCRILLAHPIFSGGKSIMHKF